MQTQNWMCRKPGRVFAVLHTKSQLRDLWSFSSLKVPRQVVYAMFDFRLPSLSILRKGALAVSKVLDTFFMRIFFYKNHEAEMALKLRII